MTPERVLIRRRDDGLEATLTVALAPDGPVEIRHCRIGNGSSRPRRIELTSYLEAVLQAAAADAAHPAFAKLFVQTEAVAERRALLATRRPRGADERRFWIVHWLIGEPAPAALLQFETDRQRFIGRGRSLAAPAALATDAPLSGTTGNVLDPILSLRAVVELAPGEERALAFGLGFAATRADALALAARHAAQADITGVLGDAPAEPPPSATPSRSRAAARPRYRPASLTEPWAPPEAEELLFDNGIGGFAAGRARVRAAPRAGRAPAPALDPCGRQRDLRLHRLRERRRHDLVGQQPGEPPDALVQRPGQRPARGGALPP